MPHLIVRSLHACRRLPSLLQTSGELLMWRQNVFGKAKKNTKNNSFCFGALTGNDFMFFLTRWLEISSLFEFWQPESVFQKHHQQKAQKKNRNVYSRISVKSDRQKTLNPEEGTTNALSTIYQMLHVFFPLNYNLKKTKKQTRWNDKCVSAKFFFLFLTSSDESSRPHQQQQRLRAHFKNDHKL